MTDLERLLALEEIRALKARYFRFTDTKDWDGLASLFAEDLQADITDDRPGCVLSNRDDFVAMARAGLEQCTSVHHGHCPEITITSDTTADGIWAMEDRLEWHKPEHSPVRSMIGCGHYIETYRKIEGEWRIQTLKVRRLRIDVVPWEPASQE